MKNVVAILSCVLLISCFSEPKKEIKDNNSAYDESYSPISDTSLTNINSEDKEQVKNIRFAYIIIKSEIPEIYNGERYKFSSKVEYTKEERTEYFCNLSFKDSLIVSKVIEIEDYNLETEQNTMLKYKNEVKEKLFEKDKWLLGIKLEECENTEDLVKIKNSNPYSKILNTQIFVFNSYSEATENKKKLYSKM